MLHFTNEAIDIEQLPKYEALILSKPHPSYWKIIVINLFIFSFIIAGILSVLFFTMDEFKSYVYPIIIAFLLFIVLLFVLYRTSFKKRGYALRERDLVFKSGIIAETTTIVPFNRIQHVSLDEGLFSRMFKLGKIQIYTAGGSSGHLIISGIEIEKARNIKDALLKKLITSANTTEVQP